jgi:hypothetical protein
MKTFHDAATAHYEVASQTFHSTLLRSPALMLFSKTDPIGTAQSNKKAYENWEKLGLKVSSLDPGTCSSCNHMCVPRLPVFLVTGSLFRKKKTPWS